MTREDFGKWIRDLRKECDYTQDKLAHLLGFNSSQSIANIESGRATLPKKFYKKFAEIFRLDKEKFIDAIMVVNRSEISKIVYGRKRRYRG